MGFFNFPVGWVERQRPNRYQRYMDIGSATQVRLL
jgi:hypothetical protein